MFNHAACLITGLTRAHAFASGNRRTAYLVAKSFLEENKSNLKVKDGEEAIAVLKRVREGSINEKELKAWLKGD
ncbi:hypothetical protein AUJ14_01640 [Candidatus Micrarchaeota archaeon CG1_02_55_22]|nr:MAG: hypothetical protein AUJ14_01640 [Candidatus Micrarchaeota archaeon CG1_02_55_22]